MTTSDDFASVTGEFRAELLVHCYRMLGGPGGHRRGRVQRAGRAGLTAEQAGQAIQDLAAGDGAAGGAFLLTAAGLSPAP